MATSISAYLPPTHEGRRIKNSQFSGVTFVFARRDEVNSLWKMK